jgi:DNA polymerase
MTDPKDTWTLLTKLKAYLDSGFLHPGEDYETAREHARNNRPLTAGTTGRREPTPEARSARPAAPPPSRAAAPAEASPSVGGASPRPKYPDMSLEQRREALAALEEEVRSCTKCPLHAVRSLAVPGVGVLDPLIMVVGEGPGAQEDRRGLPFVGNAGQYLDKWLAAIDCSRGRNVYITNIVKCRPPQNRDPAAEESDACLPYLQRQVEIVRPRTILSVGRISSRILSGENAGIGSLRGRDFMFRGIPLVATYHPSAVLRNQDLRRPVWEDLKRLRAILDGTV